MFLTVRFNVVGSVNLGRRSRLVVLGRDSRDRLRLGRLVFGNRSRSDRGNGCLVLALFLQLLFGDALTTCDNGRRSSSSRVGQSGLRLRVLASSERVSRRDGRRDIGLAGGVGLLSLRLGGLGLLLLLFLLSAAPAGPQQVLDRIFELVESIGSYYSGWLANATKRAE